MSTASPLPRSGNKVIEDPAREDKAVPATRTRARTRRVHPVPERPARERQADVQPVALSRLVSAMVRRRDQEAWSQRRQQVRRGQP